MSHRWRWSGDHIPAFLIAKEKYRSPIDFFLAQSRENVKNKSRTKVLIRNLSAPLPDGALQPGAVWDCAFAWRPADTT